MTDTLQNCSSGLSLIIITISPKRVCNITSAECVSNDFDIHGVQYSHAPLRPWTSQIKWMIISLTAATGYKGTHSLSIQCAA